MRDIKFRARDIKTGEIVYGDYISPWDSPNPNIRVSRDFHKDERGRTVAFCYYHEVDPDSVAQLIAYDKNGKEVYEGDLVKRILEWNATEEDYVEVDSWEFAASFEDYHAILAGEIVLVKAKEK